jgi:Na+/melibiose symporter-like transporter
MSGTRHRRSSSGLLRNRDFVLLWGGQTVSEFGSWITFLALPLTAVVTLHASTSQVGLLSAATTAAFLFVTLPAGVAVDRLRKRTLLLLCDIARMLLIASVPFAALSHVLTIGQLYSVAFLTGIATVVFTVAYQSYLPALVTRDHLVDANGKLQASAEVAEVAGQGAGGGLFGLLGAAGAMGADAASYAVSIGSLLLMRAREPEPDRMHGHARPRLLKELTAGLAYVFREPILRKTTGCSATFNLFAAVTAALQVIFLVRILHVRPAYAGLVIAAAALGGVAGGAASSTLSKLIGSARILWVSVLGFGLVGLLIPLARPGWGISLFIVGSAGLQFSVVTYSVAQISYRQAVCPPMLLGRMNAAIRWVTWGAIPFGGLLASVLGSAIGVRGALWIAAVGAWAAGLWVWLSPLRAMRNIPQGDEAHVPLTPAAHES